MHASKSNLKLNAIITNKTPKLCTELTTPFTDLGSTNTLAAAAAAATAASCCLRRAPKLLVGLRVAGCQHRWELHRCPTRRPH